MNFDEKDLLLAQKKGVISAEVFEKLLDFLKNLNAYRVVQVSLAKSRKLR